MNRSERARAPLPRLPQYAMWCRARRNLSWRRYVHVAHREIQVTLCGRVRPGDEISALVPGLEYCPRCLYRANSLWVLR